MWPQVNFKGAIFAGRKKPRNLSASKIKRYAVCHMLEVRHFSSDPTALFACGYGVIFSCYFYFAHERTFHTKFISVILQVFPMMPLKLHSNLKPALREI